jgi:2-polyprenyl-3-methyl-5-hydroxy-6-metoxy-1,4-benzoquinol methylase
MEFTKYDKLGAYHWREFELPTKYREHALHVANWIGSGLTLDVGAGDGLITWLINSESHRACVGIDDNKKAVELAQEKGENVELLSIYELNVKEQFDNIYCGDVIEHLEFPAVAVNKMRDALRPNGKLYMVTPPALPSGKVQDPHHYFEWTPEQMEQFMHRQEMEMQNILVRPNLKRMYAVFTKTNTP